MLTRPSKDPVEASPTFVLFVLESGMQFGLWSKHTVQPVAALMGGGTELAFAVHNNDAVNATCEDWQKKQIQILQKPTRLDFGYAFTARDPDGHRLRVFAPAE